MALYNFTAGTAASAAEVDSDFGAALGVAGKNTIRQLQSSTVDFSTDMTDGYGEAYVDEDGRLGSVNETTATTAKWSMDDSTFYPGINDEASGDTTSDPDSFTNASNAFDNDPTTYASKTGLASGTATYTLGKTFAAKTVNVVYVKAYMMAANYGASGSMTMKLQTYNGSTWDDVETFINVSAGSLAAQTIREYVVVNSSVQGVRIEFAFTAGDASYDKYARLYKLEYGDMEAGEISHAIPSGSFPTAITSAFATVLTDNWESGVTIDYKLKNSGGDDSGWLTANQISNFTTFANGEPDEYVIRLTPKSSSPTNGYPSIKGAWVIAQ